MPIPPAGYYGKILSSPFSSELRQKVASQIDSCSSFDLMGLKVMPYIAAWKTDHPQMWYEFVSDRFLTLFHCQPEELVGIFRSSIIDHRQYHHTDIFPDIKELTLSKNDLDSQRFRLRKQTVKEGSSEVIYKVAPPGRQEIWLKDWATVTIFKEDGICLSPGFLCDVSLEMNSKDQVDTINVTVNRDKDVLVEAEKIEAFDQLSTTVFHEIRNPILSIGALANRLLKKPEEIKSQSYIAVIAKEATRLENILSQLFNYTRKVQPTLQPTSLSALVKKVLHLLQSNFAEQNIQIRLKIEKDVPPIMADQEQIHLALVHIIKNSIDAVSEGGTISIRVSAQNNRVAVLVRDNGGGIAGEHAKRVTEPFFTTRMYGTGLGLSLVQKVVNLHQGALSFSRPDGGGTEVQIQLPQIPSSGIVFCEEG